MIPSPKVSTYDLKPEMSAEEIEFQLINAIKSKMYDLIIINFANPDMVGHTGNLKAAIKAVERVDTAIGNIKELPKKCQSELKEAIEKTKQGSGTTLILALSYSSRWEIINAIKQIVKNEVSEKNINEELFSQYLTTKGVPNPELLIRTSGEQRISNFLLWQIAYSELYFTDILWPEFRREDLFEAIYKFQQRERRFGKISEQLKEKN